MSESIVLIVEVRVASEKWPLSQCSLEMAAASTMYSRELFCRVNLSI